MAAPPIGSKGRPTEEEEQPKPTVSTPDFTTSEPPPERVEIQLRWAAWNRMKDGGSRHDYWWDAVVAETEAAGYKYTDALRWWNERVESVPVPDVGGPAVVPTSPTDGVAAQYAESLISWPDLFNRDWGASDWLLEPVFARGRGHALYAPAGEGKSEVVLYCALAAATGRSLMPGAPATEPLSVVYFDLEMTEDDLHDRLMDFDVGPNDDLSHFAYYLLPDLPPLDTREGGWEARTLAEYHRADLVVIDTTGRVVEGPENDSDTYLAFARHTGFPLKADGRTVVRLDHAGKDPSKKQRGSSAKGDDVDIVWRLSRTQGGVRLKAEKKRSRWVPEIVDLARREPPLRYEQTGTSWVQGTAELAKVLDGLGIPDDASRPVARAALKAAGEKATNDVLASAIKYRKQRVWTPSSVSDSTSDRSPRPALGQLNGQPPENPSGTGRTVPRTGSDSISATDSDSAVPLKGDSYSSVEAQEGSVGVFVGVLGSGKARIAHDGQILLPGDPGYEQATREMME